MPQDAGGLGKVTGKENPEGNEEPLIHGWLSLGIDPCHPKSTRACRGDLVSDPKGLV